MISRLGSLPQPPTPVCQLFAGRALVGTEQKLFSIQRDFAHYTWLWIPTL